MTTELILSNARIVTGQEVFVGSLRAADGFIESVDSGSSTDVRAADLDGDLLIPGLVELHTDNLEKHLVPRPEVVWPTPLAALMAHDAQISCAGITTVLDAIFLGSYEKQPLRRKLIHKSIGAVLKAREMNLCRSEHLLHLRCEVPEQSLMSHLEPYIGEPSLKLLSLNDHTPGQRQWRQMESYKAYHQIKDYSNTAVAAIVTRYKEQQVRHAFGNRQRVAAICHSTGVALASHDDTTASDVLQAVNEGVTICEFPTTLEAATKARQCGLKIVAGAPNLVRGTSHSGNISVLELAKAGLLDALSSDYVPASLLHGAFLLHQQLDYTLPDALATVTSNPATMIGLTDRGEIAPGRRADLVRVSLRDGLPIVRTVWKLGNRVS